jgi:virginiamycin B lyase
LGVPHERRQDGIIDSKTELYMGPGSRPRRVATAPEGKLWVTLYGKGKLAHIDPAAARVMKEYEMPAGANGEPYAVAVDGARVRERDRE